MIDKIKLTSNKLIVRYFYYDAKINIKIHLFFIAERKLLVLFVTETNRNIQNQLLSRVSK